jgi:methylase of polypeptide subunit release factors
LHRISAEIGGSPPDIARADLAALEAACGADEDRCKRWIKRRLAGEPIAHIVGRVDFRGLRLRSDKRAYVTDPELTHLVEAVLHRLAAWRGETGREPLLAEVGAGGGALALAIEQARPGTRIVGLDLDPDALAVAAANAADLGSTVRWIESDLFDSWPADLPEPDLIYGDPPWGDETTLYAPDRPAHHYRAMPPASAFALGGRTGAHAQILTAAARRGWRSEIWLNAGSLPPAELAGLAPAGAPIEIVAAAPGVSLVRCRLRPGAAK